MNFLPLQTGSIDEWLAASRSGGFLQVVVSKGRNTPCSCRRLAPSRFISNEADRVKSFFAPDLSSLTHTTTLLCNLVFLFGG
jgi:hypothetical protein